MFNLGILKNPLTPMQKDNYIENKSEDKTLWLVNEAQSDIARYKREADRLRSGVFYIINKYVEPSFYEQAIKDAENMIKNHDCK